MIVFVGEHLTFCFWVALLRMEPVQPRVCGGELPFGIKTRTYDVIDRKKKKRRTSAYISK